MKQNTGLEFVHGDLYGVAMGVAKKFVSKQSTRPTLQYARHTADGDIIATDSHRLVHIKNIHGFKEEYLVDPKHFNFAKGQYPDTDRLSRRDEHDEAIVLTQEQIKLWLQIFKSVNQTLKVMKDNMGTVNLWFKENHVEVELKKHNIVIKLPHEVYQKPETKVITFQAEYMRDALEAHHKLNSEQLTFYFKRQMRPMILDNDIDVKVLVLPVRTFEGR